MNAEHLFTLERGNIVPRSSLGSWLIKRRWFLLFVVLPTLVSAIYYGFLATDVYVSESRFVIKSPDQKRSQTSTLANLIQTTGLSGGQEQTNEVLAYVRSRDALKALEQSPNVRRIYSASNIDFVSRFPQPFAVGSFENLYKFYGRMVDANLDHETSVAVIRVKAFSPDDAYTINRRLLELSEALVNRLNARAQSKGIEEAQRQVELATARAKRARVALAEYRKQKSLKEPSNQALVVLEIANTLTAQRAALQAQVDQMERATPNNPSLPALRNKVNAISHQIASQDSRVVGSNNGIASKLGGYENLLVEQEFATQSLNVANAGLVQAAGDAQRQQFYLERVVDPNVPDTPALPRRFLSVLVVAAVAMCLYLIGWMLVVGILEHAPDN